MLVTVLIFTPLQLLMFVPKILYATGVLKERKQISLNKGGSVKSPNQTYSAKTDGPNTTQKGESHGDEGGRMRLVLRMLVTSVRIFMQLFQYITMFIRNHHLLL
jgi:hypothetical protein